MKKTSVFALIVIALLVIDLAALVYINASSDIEACDDGTCTSTTQAAQSGNIVPISSDIGKQNNLQGNSQVAQVAVLTSSKPGANSNESIYSYDVEGRLLLLQQQTQKQGAGIRQQVEDVTVDADTTGMPASNILQMEDNIQRLRVTSKKPKEATTTTTTSLPCPN